MVTRRPLVLADIFCGAGGLSAGFKQAKAWWPDSRGEGFEIAYGIDNDKDAIKTFRKFHFPDVEQDHLKIVAPCQDIKDVSSESIREAIRPWENVDILIGGPNCQGVSAAGLRNPDDRRNEMLLAFIRLVRELRPKWFVMENVPGLTHANNRELLAIIFKEFEKIEGYQVSGDVLLAADYGVPQFRYRLFIIGTTTGAPIRFPPATHVPPPSDGSLRCPEAKQTYRTVEQEISDLTDCPLVVYEKSASPECQSQPDSCPLNHYCVELGKVNKDRIVALAPGQDWRDMPIRLLPERYFATRASDQKGAYGRLVWNWPAYTITGSAYNVTAGPFTHPKENRALSVREAARLQSFSDDHAFDGNVLSQYRQVGNAVPPKLAEAVARAILYCHYRGEEAKNWGKEGRLNLELIQNSLEGSVSFPTMTPRRVHPLFNRRQRKRTLSRRQPQRDSESSKSVWDADLRALDLNPEDTLRLRKLAVQPGNYRAAKRAKAIVQFIDRAPKRRIIEEANVSEESVRKWVDGYVEYGLDGWRAYHTPIEQIAGYDGVLIEKMREAVRKARRINVKPSRNGLANGELPKRLYMNDYLLDLISRFGDKSVWQIIDETEVMLGYGVGTVYVGDLLAIYSVVLSELEQRAEQLSNPAKPSN